MSGNSKKYPCRCLGRITVKGRAPRIRPSGKVYIGKSRECGCRRSLRRKPEQYVRQPQCPQCGTRNWALDTHRIKNEMGNEPMCMCSGLHFPHRKGTKYCEHHPNYENDCADRYKEALGSSKGAGVQQGDYTFSDAVDEMYKI